MGNASKKKMFKDRKALQGGHTGKVVDLRWSQKEEILVSVADDSTALVWRTDNWKKPQRINLSGPYANSVDISTNRIVIAGTTKDISMYSVGLEDPMYTLKGHEQGVSCVRFNRHRNDVLLSGSLDGSIRMWDLVRKTTIRGFGLKRCTSCTKVAWCNGKFGERVFLASFEDTTVKLFDARKKSGETVSFDGHESDVNSVTWAPDDSFFASASSDSTVCLWDVKMPGKPFKVLRAGPIKGDALDVSIAGGFCRRGSGTTSKDSETFVYVSYEESPFLAVWPVDSDSLPSKPAAAATAAKEVSSDTSAARRPSYMHPALSKRVTCVEVSPTGKYFATGDWGSQVIIWDIEETKRAEWHTSGFYEIY